jgi:SAM-dependent methyltransferase
MPPATTWPKPFPELSDEQLAIRDDFMKYFHETYPEKYSWVSEFNRRYPARTALPGTATLEIGAGIGEHMQTLSAMSERYVALELRDDMAAVIHERYPDVETVVGDIEEGLELESESFDRVVAVHVLEHLRNLPVALDEVHRLLRPGGVFEIVIPCEGGLGYWAGRELTSKRMFEKRYNTDYEWYIKSEHFNVPREIIHELGTRFTREHREFFPLKVPSVHLNLFIGLTYRRAA